MEIKNNFLKRKFLILFLVSFVCIGNSFAQELSDSAMELDGDQIEYSVDRNTVIATGNVIIKQADMTLYCDEVEIDRSTQVANAQGHVRLVSEQGEITGEAVVFSFETMTGEFSNARFNAHPYYGVGKKVRRVDDNKIVMYDGYVTTSDYDKPEYRMTSERIEVFPGDKIVAHQLKPRIGNVPFMYFPRFTQSLIDTKPKLTFTPGHEKDWGTFLLSQYRFFLNENFKGTIHADYREKLDFASGFDISYKTPNTGEGLIRTYYTNERKITSDHPWQKKPSPTVERERYKAEWRHKWQIDEKTDFIGQYYLLSDRDFLNDFFENESDEDSNPETFFLVTRNLSRGTLSLRSDIRINRFETKLERLPEVRYDLPNVEIADTNVYLSSTSTFSNLALKDASPSEVRKETMRIDTTNELSYPKKIGILEFKPFVGSRHTYYSKTKDPAEYDSVRAIFRAGGSLSTKFYRIYDAYFDDFGMKVDRLRHVITPSIAHIYETEPTIDPGQLDQFDGIDGLTNSHKTTFSLENKLQTKRNGESVDLLRAIIETDYQLKEHPGSGGFDKIHFDMDFKPSDYITLFFDSQYDTKKDHLDTANFDLYINGGDKWHLTFGKRFNREVDDAFTSEYYYKFNPKWAGTIFHRWDFETGELREQQYTLRRDLHSWIMDLSINDEIDGGTEFVVIFTLKAFPDIGLDFGTTLNRRQSGSN